MVAIKGRKSSSKNPPILSHEFIIQNHADIVSCVAMVFVVGLMVQVTSPWAYMFIALNHNVSSNEVPDAGWQPVQFATGWKDSCAIFFYCLIAIVVHAVIQEYILDKLSKKLHLSKIKLTKFNESSQLTIFYVLSAIWGIDIILNENFIVDLISLRDNYSSLMSFSTKLFFIVQIAYWLHSYPELYFQRAKREELRPRIVDTTIGLFFTVAGYLLNFHQISVLLLALHYVGDALQHIARLTHIIYRREKTSRTAFMVGDSVYIFVRVATLALSFLYIYALNTTSQPLDSIVGYSEIPAIRFAALGFIAHFQAYLVYAFIKRQRQRARDSGAVVIAKVKATKQQRPKKKDTKKVAASEDDDLPEVDQATKKNLRSRTATKTK